MELNRSLVSVCTHGEGHPTKVLLSGIPHFLGKTMEEKRKHIQKHYDFLRLALCREPRGHNDQSAAIVTAPVSDQAALGFLTMDAAGHWADMSVSTAIAVVTVATQYGIIGIEGPTADIMLDTPSGLVSARVTIKDGIVDSVAIRNVAGFFVTSVMVEVPSLGRIPVDVAFGGNFFGFVKSSDVGIKVATANSAKLAQTAIAIRDALNMSVPVQHPDWHYINRIASVIIDDEPEHPEADIKCVCVFGEEGAIGIDRSPCGTGLSARMAMLHSKGGIKMHECFKQESIVGTLFKGKLVRAQPVGRYEGLICEITGRAYIVGVDIAMIDARDPLKLGFALT
jgi:proline racemase/trans-L-3-hydroxyproline dehydratase